jgi:hypothetical protein
MRPTLKAPGTKCLKLKCDTLLSTSAFKFDLRRYTKTEPAGSEEECPLRFGSRLNSMKARSDLWTPTARESGGEQGGLGERLLGLFRRRDVTPTIDLVGPGICCPPRH